MVLRQGCGAFASNTNDVYRRDSPFRSTAALDLRCCVRAMAIASISDPTPIVVQPIEVTDGQSVGLLLRLSEYKWAR